MLDVVNGPVEFVDTRSKKRQGQVLIKPTSTVIAGVAFGQPYQAPFSTRWRIGSDAAPPAAPAFPLILDVAAATMRAVSGGLI